MSLLHQESQEEIDDAALGEEFTKGSHHVVWTSAIAAVLVTIVIAIYVLAGEKPPVASGEIIHVWAYPCHVVTSGIDAAGASMAQESFDQVLVFAHVKLRNQSKVPLFIEDILANAKLGNDTLSVSAGSTGQYEEAFLAYPELAAIHGNSLPPRITLAPGESVDGTAFWVFRKPKEEWDARKDWEPDSRLGDPGSRSGLNFTFKFQYQHNLVLPPPTAITVLP